MSETLFKQVQYDLQAGFDGLWVRGMGSGDTYHNSKSRLYRLRSCSPTPGSSQMIQSRKEVLVW